MAFPIRKTLLTAALFGCVVTGASMAEETAHVSRRTARAIQLTPTEQLVERGQSRLARGNYAAARADFDRAWRAGDHSPEVHQLLIRCLVGERKLSLAEEEARRLLNEHPEMASVHVTLAHIAYLSDDYQTAIDEASVAIAQGARLADGCFVRAYAHARLGQLEEALVDSRRAAAEPRDTSDFRAEAPHLLHGAILQQLNRDEDALLAYERALRFNENSTEALVGQWTCYQRMQMLPAAFLVAEEMLAMSPDAVETLEANAVSHRQFKEYDVALQFATRWREALFSDPRPCVEQARSLIAMHRWIPARETLEEAVARDDQDLPALVELSRLLVSCPDRDIRDVEFAQQLAERACLLTDWESPTIMGILVSAHAAQGHQHQAARLIDRCLSLLPLDAPSREIYAALLSELESPDTARIAEGDDQVPSTTR
ncbi:MAG: hypothetical protein KDA93_16535 [Planctomycetaceae bacterium]|nr:hypothetical protein [Planctomycetaceae bacterium]